MDQFSLQGLVDNYLSRREDRDPTKTFHMSDMGMCMRKRILKRMGKSHTDFEPRTYRLFAVGHMIHEYFQDMLEKEGVLVHKEGEISMMGGELIGHYDAIVKAKDGLHLYELKTVHSRKILYKDVDEQYIMQGLTYMMALQPEYSIKDLRVCLISRDDLIMKETGHTLTPEWTQRIHNELGLLWESWQNKDKKLPPELEPTDKQAWLCGYCAYREHCPVAAERIAKKKRGKKC